MLNTESNIQIKDSQGTFQLAELTPEEILKDWDAISEGIELAFPPTNMGEGMEEILSLLTSGKMKCWIFSEAEKTQVLLTLLPVVDYGNKIPNLLIYSIYAYKPVNLQKWTSIMKEVKQYGKGQGFKSIIAFSNVERIIKLANVLGWSTDFRVLKVEV